MPLRRVPGCGRNCDICGARPRPHGTGVYVDCEIERNIPTADDTEANEAQRTAGEDATPAPLR